jgi:predicted KAP-like P-loop ATPase
MWSDSESNLDYLNFSEIAESVVDIINTPEMLPISIGIFGDWGAGKSTILKLTETELKSQEKNYMHICFDAWLYQGYDDARASLLEAIAEALIKEVEDNQGLLIKAKSLARRVNKIRALGIAIDVGAAAFGVPTGGAVGKAVSFAQDAISSDDIDEEKFLEDGAEHLKNLGTKAKGLIREKEIKSPPQEISEFRKEYSELLNEIKRPLVVYIDNLDRCTPLNAIHTLEAIRLFLFLPNTAFVIAADEEMIRSAVREYHKGANERHQTDYLDKLIQVPIKVPKPGALEVRAYLFMLLASDLGVGDENLKTLQAGLSQSLRNSWKEKPISVANLMSELTIPESEIVIQLEESLNVAERITPLLSGSSRINGNPRIVKRLLNVIKMRKRVSDRRGMNLDESLITKLVIFERCAGKDATLELYRQIDEGDGSASILGKLEDEEEDIKLHDSWMSNEEFIRNWIKLPPSLKDLDLRAAAYLSRETMPLSIVSNAMSSEAKGLVEILLVVKSRNSPKAIEEVNKIPQPDYLSVIEALVTSFRTCSDWSTRPTGFDGAVILANKDSECKEYLRKFLNTIPKQRWLTAVLKELN